MTSPLVRRLGLVAFGVACALVVVEGALQVLAYATWRAARREATLAVEGRETVLCVGDSFTFGLGAAGADGAYPAQLEVELERRTPGRFAVANRGWPGQDSRDVLRALPGQLERHRPSIVLVLVGTNDRWSRPERLAPGDVGAGAEAGFVWRLRTARLLRLLAQHETERDAAIAGPWHGEGGLEVELRPDGTVAGGGDWRRWRTAGERLTIETAAGREVRFRYEVAGDSLRLEAALRPRPIELVRGLRPARASDDPVVTLMTRATVAANDVAAGRADLDAARGAMAALAVHPPTPADRAAVGRLLAATERLGDPDTELVALEWALAGLPRFDPAVAAVDRLARSAATRPAVVDAVRSAVSRAGEPGESGASRGGETGEDRAVLLRVLARLLLPVDPVGALRATAEAFAIDGDRDATVWALRTGIDRYPPEVCAPVRSELADRPDVAAAFEALLERAAAPEAGTGAVLEAHLRAIVVRCRDAGATPWLLTYPEPIAVVDAAVRTVAASERVEWVDVPPRFARALEEVSREDLFVPDGHLTGSGYGVLAALVADAPLAD